MEYLLQYAWKYKLYASMPLITTTGEEISVLDPGIQNNDAGPDFFNAKIKHGDTVWAGSVEIHDKASDWLKHKHNSNKAYDSVILHVTGENDTEIARTNGEHILQLVITIPDKVRNNIDWLISKSKQSLPCSGIISQIEPFVISSWMNALVSERLERKVGDIVTLLKRYNNDWNEVFYIILMRNFGFNLNSDAFERLAHSLPMNYIRKQRYSLTQIEALVFGQAGMLEKDIDNEYYRLLQKEYTFLAHKFNLVQPDLIAIKNARTRPVNLPHVRLAQVSALWHKYDTLFSQFLHMENMGEIFRQLRISASEFWDTRHTFETVTSAVPIKKTVGERAANLIMINTVAPMIFAYGQQNNLPELCERAITFLEQLKPESNYITEFFSKSGFKIKNAADSQSVIQLRKEYCEKKKCMYCRMGFYFMKRE